ncbi:MAG: hypothetical protein ACKOX6_07010, partial [Bdellovibrio sp.]
LFMILLFATLWVMWRRQESNSKTWFMVMFLLVSMGATLVILPSQLGAPLRYAFNIVYGPFFFLPVLLDVLFGEKWTNKALLTASAVLLVWGLGTIQSPQAIANLRTYYPEEVKCLDENLSSRGITQGISGYWDAKRIAYTSHAGLQLAQLNMDEKTYHYWITNKKVFTGKYDFIIAHNSYRPEYEKTVEQIAADFGAPLETIDCGVYKAMLYPPDLIASKMKSTVVKK